MNLGLISGFLVSSIQLMLVAGAGMGVKRIVQARLRGERVNRLWVVALASVLLCLAQGTYMLVHIVERLLD